MEVEVCVGKKVRTAAIKAVHAEDVRGAHLRGPADGDVGVGDGNDGRLPVPREGKPVEQIHSRDQSCELKL